MKILSNPLWFAPVFLLLIIGFIEVVHTKAHLEQEIDVHGHCKQFLRKNPSAYTEDD
jgi:hypothetical protein|tara:strand:- start:3460 stop:3630 length:171 start_codon:yes stop_codon:yes gene_type:complete